MRRRLVAIGTAVTLLSAVVLPASAQVVGDVFEIAYGDTVVDGVPGSGAGNLETGGSEDSYTFEAVSGDAAIFDTLTGSTTTFRWRLEGPGGVELFDSAYVDLSVALVDTGEYILTVYGTSTVATGIYSFRLLKTPPPEEFSLDFGDTVADGIPAPGAGNIEVPGASDVYSFQAAAGETAIFDVLAGPTSGLRWILLAPDGTELFNVIYSDRALALPQTGVYRLTVSGLTVAGTGMYSFALLGAPDPQEFTIAIGETVSDGVPEPGAGNLESAGAVDRYLFEADPGQVVIFDATTGSTTDVRWSLQAPGGSVLFDGFYIDQQVTLIEAGTYALVVEGQGVAGSGAYSFALVDVPPQFDHFTIGFDDTISDGVPGPGAGNIEGPGAIDTYAFEASAGDETVFDALAAPASGLRWSLQAPSGAVIFDGIFADREEALPSTGTYTLTVSGLNVTSLGVYSFQLRLAPENADPVAVDDFVETVFNSSVVVDVLANDSDPDGDPLTIDSVDDPGNGTTVTDGHHVTYTPDPGFSGDDTFIYRVMDGAGGVDEASVVVTVHPPLNGVPSILDIADKASVVGDIVNVQVQASDPDGDLLDYSASGLPPGLMLDTATGEITGSIQAGADTGSPYTVEIVVSDPEGAAAVASFQWTVHPAAPGGLEAEIDIPLSCIFVNGYGVIPVVIYGSAEIDVRQVDLSTVELEGMPVQRIWHRYVAMVFDSDRDGFKDLMVLIDEQPNALSPGATTATLVGLLNDGSPFTGSDEICVRPG